MRRRNCRKENSEELAESHAHRGNRAGLDDQKQRPAVKKSPQRPQRLAQVNVLPASARHHGGEFAIAERGHDGHEPGHGPRANQQRRRIDFARNFRRHNKDAGADHRPHHQHGGAGQAEAFDQFVILMAMNFPVAARNCRVVGVLRAASGTPMHSSSLSRSGLFSGAKNSR